MSDQHPAEGRLGPGHIRCVRGIPTSADTPQHGFWTTTRNLVMRFSLKTAYGIVAEPFRALNDLYTSGGDITHALSMSSSRALNAYHEASRAETVLSFETCVRKNDGPAQIVLICAEEMMSWDVVRNFWRVAVDIGTMDGDASCSEQLRQSLATRMITLRTKPMKILVWKLLKETRTIECADQRDRVYALFSVDSEGHELIEADYEKSITPLVIAHDILRSKYATRSPRTLNDVLVGCEFLGGVFRMPRGAMQVVVQYRPTDGRAWTAARGHAKLSH